MRVNSVGQENNRNNFAVAKAGLLGAGAGTIAKYVIPLTQTEHDFYFNESAKAAIKQKVSKVRGNEIEKITQEFTQGTLNVSKDAYDVFERNKEGLKDGSEGIMESISNASGSVKDGVKSLISRVDSVGVAKQHIETSNIKNAAKSARPLLYFAAIGSIIAMTGQVLVNAFNKHLPKEQEKSAENKDVTMADILLEGLGSNTEILLLAKEAEENK